jgi:4-amino-4-deoxy-L-arabinose transferase-like glycosyltransferase
VRTRISAAMLSLFCLICAVLPFPLSIALAGGGGNTRTGEYFVWQLFRRPNHTWDFYLTSAAPAIGILVILAGLAGLWLLRRSTSWREKMLLAWIIVPMVFFQLWPTKGFQYILPIAPAIALLAARMLALWPENAIRIKQYLIPRYVPGVVFGVAIAATLMLNSVARIVPSQSPSFLAGSGGVPGGREMGQWIKDTVPQEATFLTIGPSMANLVQFYGHRQAYGLSVSPNPLHRNPSYEPIINPDFQIRMGEVQYLVWDSFSAERTSFFSEKLTYYMHKYHGRVVHVETVQIKNPDGTTTDKPVIIIYEVHP